MDGAVLLAEDAGAVRLPPIACPQGSVELTILSFRLLIRHYERGSLIGTSNKSFTDWGEVFNYQTLGSWPRRLDRSLHHATTLKIIGESDRLRDQRKNGLFGRRPPSEPLEGTPDASI